MFFFAPGPCPSPAGPLRPGSLSYLPGLGGPGFLPHLCPSSKSGPCLGCLWVLKMELSLKVGPLKKTGCSGPQDPHPHCLRLACPYPANDCCQGILKREQK